MSYPLSIQMVQVRLLVNRIYWWYHSFYSKRPLGGFGIEHVVSLMKPTLTVMKHTRRRAYADRMAEREFVRTVLARKMTPEIERRLADGARQAQVAMKAPFLAKFRRPDTTTAA